MQFVWYLKRFGLESILRGGLSAAFRVICSILSRVSFWIYFRLVRVYLGDQRMRRVKDQDEEGKGPGDQEDPGTRDQGKGPEDQGTRGPGDQRTRGPKDQGNLKLFFQTSKFIFFSRVLDFLSRKLRGGTSSQLNLTRKWRKSKGPMAWGDCTTSPKKETCYLNHVLWQMGMSTISELVLWLYTPDCWLLWYPHILIPSW